jgi:hypothetical protein
MSLRSRVGRLGFRSHTRAASAAVLALLLSACSRPVAWKAGDVSSGHRQAPFRAAADSGNPKAETPAKADQESGQKGDSDLPFRDKLDLPAGTLLTVRLSDPITAENPASIAPFQASVDEPVQVKGDAISLRGAIVEGQVETVRPSQVKPNSGYVRLTLTDIHLDGRDVTLQTASLFVPGNPQNPKSKNGDAAVRLDRGRRLTFRLIEPLVLSTNASVH